MGLCDLLGGDAGQVMTVHEERHPFPPLLRDGTHRAPRSGRRAGTTGHREAPVATAGYLRAALPSCVDV